MSTPPEQPAAHDAKPGAPRRGLSDRSPREILRNGGMLALVVLATLFAVLNLDEVKVDWVVGSGRAPLIVVIVISLLAGIVLTYLAGRINRRRR
jgi:hypothetical protein